MKQMKINYEILQRLNENYMSKKLKTTRKYNKLMNYAIVFANRDKLIIFTFVIQYFVIVIDLLDI